MQTTDRYINGVVLIIKCLLLFCFIASADFLDHLSRLLPTDFWRGSRPRPRGDEFIDFSAARVKTFAFASFARQIGHL